jgi:hypothetical protein
MTRVQVLLTEEQDQKLESLARALRTSKARLVREGVDLPGRIDDAGDRSRASSLAEIGPCVTSGLTPGGSDRRGAASVPSRGNA